jgi:ATP-dependent helicase/nuclease subunit A
MKTAGERASETQLQASDPAVSAFVAASAGSGKTKLLIDRLLRLMLTGATPERILCLTYTRAAAAEMALRLRRELAAWVRADDAWLADRLAALRLDAGPAGRASARRLFAGVLDLPGGMRIDTIHSFCQSLLRRFPLEAAVSPHFELLEESDSRIGREAAREAALEQAESATQTAALVRLAGLCTAAEFGKLIEGLGRDPGRIADALRLPERVLAAAQRRVLGVHHESTGEIIAQAVAWPEEAALRRALLALATVGSEREQARAAELLDWLARSAADRASEWPVWSRTFVDSNGQPRKLGYLIRSRAARAHPAISSALAAEIERVATVEDACCAVEMAATSAALMGLARPALDAYADAKHAAGRLDYDDLIGRTLGLLVDPGAAWVLYKLDGGLDHLLLDEVQDTSGAQWRIADALSCEFFAGEGARDGRRTVFAVGDRKQSIFSFQGAAPDEFDRWRARWRDRVVRAGQQWRDLSLEVSFRSTRAVLEVVDAVFATAEAGDGVVAGSEALRHLAHRADHAGAVELWPLEPSEPEVEPPPWNVPAENQKRSTAPGRLAERLAQRIRLEIEAGAVRPGEVMVLVRHRTAFDRALMRALKQHGVSVAGADRMTLIKQPAVADLLSLCDALLMPQDDLALATVLTSPLGGLTDDSLMRLALPRTGTLWDALQAGAAAAPDWAAACGFLEALLARVDYLTPHALLAEALGRLGGRARLFARFGPEAGEPVDELLRAALDYAALRAPSLQGFVHWLRRSGAEIKRDQESAPDAVRIMTVHAAKGLEAPLVILPDTTGLPRNEAGVCWMEDAETAVAVPLWAPHKELRCARAEAQRQQDEAASRREYRRLLYVAMTRARDRLIVCGWAPRNSPPQACWHRLVEHGFDALGIGRPEELRIHACAGRGSRTTATARPAARPPPWAGSPPSWQAPPPPAEPPGAISLAPSRPEGALLGSVPAAASPLRARNEQDRFRRGRLIHALLQHLPDIAPAGRMSAGLAFLQRPGHGIAAEEATALIAETLAILDHPELAPVFGPGSRAEVPLTGVVAGSVVGGLVDRLAVLPERALLVDFKTNRDPPIEPAATPALYLRQMAAYRAVLRGVFPSRAIVCALVWTRAARVMPLPEALLDAYAPGVPRIAA